MGDEVKAFADVDKADKEGDGSVLQLAAGDIANETVLHRFPEMSNVVNSSDVDDIELTCAWKRRSAKSAEAYGACNERRAAFAPPKAEKSDVDRGSLFDALRAFPLFMHLQADRLEAIVDAMPVETLEAGSWVWRRMRSLPTL